MNMNKKPLRLSDRSICLAGLLILLIAGIAALCSGNGDFSGWERRYLAEKPGVPSLTDWKTDRETETYLTDHIPFRRELVATDSTVQLLTGRRTQLNAWPVSGSIIEKPVGIRADVLTRRLEQFGTLAENAGADWVLLTPPTHGWLLKNRMAPLMRRAYEQEAVAYGMLETCENAILLPDTFTADPDRMYYRTDHHWSAEGAWEAYAALGDRLGYIPLPLSDFRLSEYDGFYGTTLSRSGLPAFIRDRILTAEPPSGISMTDGENRYDRLIFPENMETYDGYATYMNGNHGLVRIDNPGAAKGTLLVFKDSFANCLLPMLSAHYRTVIAVDARYYGAGFSEAVKTADQPETILYLYSLDSLMNDTELTKKLRR